MTDLTIDGEVFRVEVEGSPERPVVLLSSSLGADLSLWDAQMPALLEHFRVVRYDSRGHGGSTADGAPYSLARLGADALAILDALSIETAHFIGISMGGAVGLWLLANAPERIARAVLANTAARLGAADDWNRRITTVLSQGTESLVSGTMERWFSEDFRRTEADRVAPVEAVFRATWPAGYAGCCAALRDMDLREALSGIERPVLLITGHDDPVTSETDIALMTGAIRSAQHVVLDCKHISNIEAAAVFNAAVVKFLTGRLARPRVARKLAAPTRRATSGRATAARSPLKASRPKAAPSTKRAGGRSAKAKVGVPRSAATEARAAVAAVPAKKSTAKKAIRTKGGSTKRTAKAVVGKTSKPVKKGMRATTSAKKTAKSSVTKKAVPKKPVAKKASSARRRPAKTHRGPGGRRKR